MDISGKIVGGQSLPKITSNSKHEMMEQVGSQKQEEQLCKCDGEIIPVGTEILPKQTKIKFPYLFKNEKLFEQCFKTKNYGIETGEECYQRYEFYGDKLLEHLISEQLFEDYTKASVGDLSKMHAFIRSNNVLSEIYDIFELPEIKYGRTDSKTESKKVKANIMEAIIGTVKIDSNYETAKNLFKLYYYPKMKISIEENLETFNLTGKVHTFFQVNKITPEEIKIDLISQNAESIMSKQFILRFVYNQKQMEYIGIGLNYKNAKKVAYLNAYNNVVNVQ